MYVFIWVRFLFFNTHSPCVFLPFLIHNLWVERYHEFPSTNVEIYEKTLIKEGVQEERY